MSKANMTNNTRLDDVGGGKADPGKPYFLSFVEEYWQGQQPHSVIARIEVCDYDKDDYPIEEIRIGTYKLDEYQRFREEWDFKDVSAEELDQIRLVARVL